MTVRVSQTIEDISELEWHQIVPPDFPFARYPFFLSLEKSGSVGPRTGWLPYYLTLSDDLGLAGAFVVYAKSNSYGEYIFDFAWAQAYANYGLQYYPKLVSAIPFTPATGPKLLFRHGLGDSKRDEISAALLEAAFQLGKKIGASSLHALFLSPTDIALFEKKNLFLRHSFQFHWQNNGYVTFADFLKSLTSKRRKEISRERRQVSDSKVQIERLTGDQLRPEHAGLMYEFYLSTLDKMGGIDYLTHDFFKRVFVAMKDQILFILARDPSGRAVAGALNFISPHTLFGRHWGCLAEYRSLHFELCYYQGIEFAIERGIKVFEAGAQGEHKLSRGFLPKVTYSAHSIEDPRMGGAIRHFVEREKEEIRKVFAVYKEHSPFC